jgi:hypothetical protein
MTRAELLLRMSASEFAYWIGYYQREQREQAEAQERAKDKAEAQRMSQRMAGIR